MNYEELIQNELFKKAFETFLRVEEVSDVIIIGSEGGVRRIIFGDDKSFLSELRKNLEEPK